MPRAAGRGTALVTGGFGFLGRSVAQHLQECGYRVIGIGHGHFGPGEARRSGFDSWLAATVTPTCLNQIREPLDLIVHCAGHGSVGFSLSQPLEDFNSTVRTTAEVLEYVRVAAPKALLIYPSSAAVYGSQPDAPIRESCALNPVSPYGYHKRITEDLLASYSRFFGIRIAIIRYFSIYGPGVKKQLLWDASLKLRTGGGGAATFSGSGEETRDWIFASDAAQLITAVAASEQQFLIVNGASGVRSTVAATLKLLNSCLGAHRDFRFDNIIREGDPRFYHADIERACALGWKPKVALEEGIRRYADWLQVAPELALD